MNAPVQNLIDRLQAAGGKLSLEDGQMFVEAPAPLPDELVEQLRAAKPALLDMLTKVEPEVDTRPGGNIILLAVPPGVPEAWIQGVRDLLAMPRPAAWPEERWAALRKDAFAFLRDNGAEAVGLGWHELDLFGIDPRAPLARFDAMGLVVLLNGKRVVELHHDRAIIEDHHGQRTSFTRQPAPPSRVAVWKLDQSRGHVGMAEIEGTAP